jgi:hypothetical protein
LAAFASANVRVLPEETEQQQQNPQVSPEGFFVGICRL